MLLFIFFSKLILYQSCGVEGLCYITYIIILVLIFSLEKNIFVLLFELEDIYVKDEISWTSLSKNPTLFP